MKLINAHPRSYPLGSIGFYISLFVFTVLVNNLMPTPLQAMPTQQCKALFAEAKPHTPNLQGFLKTNTKKIAYLANLSVHQTREIRLKLNRWLEKVRTLTHKLNHRAEKKALDLVLEVDDLLSIGHERAAFKKAQPYFFRVEEAFEKIRLIQAIQKSKEILETEQGKEILSTLKLIEMEQERILGENYLKYFLLTRHLNEIKNDNSCKNGICQSTAVGLQNGLGLKNKSDFISYAHWAQTLKEELAELGISISYQPHAPKTQSIIETFQKNDRIQIWSLKGQPQKTLLMAVAVIFSGQRVSHAIFKWLSQFSKLNKILKTPWVEEHIAKELFLFVAREEYFPELTQLIRSKAPLKDRMERLRGLVASDNTYITALVVNIKSQEFLEEILSAKSNPEYQHLVRFIEKIENEINNQNSFANTIGEISPANKPSLLSQGIWNTTLALTYVVSTKTIIEMYQQFISLLF